MKPASSPASPGLRVARLGAAPFVFTFSRHTLPPDAAPVAGQAFTFTQFSGGPQIFVTAEQLAGELGAAGFDADPDVARRSSTKPDFDTEERDA